jgi:hypothetical protein
VVVHAGKDSCATGRSSFAHIQWEGFSRGTYLCATYTKCFRLSLTSRRLALLARINFKVRAKIFGVTVGMAVTYHPRTDPCVRD